MLLKGARECEAVDRVREGLCRKMGTVYHKHMVSCRRNFISRAKPGELVNLQIFQFTAEAL